MLCEIHCAIVCMLNLLARLARHSWTDSVGLMGNTKGGRMNWLLVAIGGMLGSMARYGISTAVAACFTKPLLPYGMMTVNILGCFLIGVFFGIVQVKHGLRPELVLLIVVGFLGGFTTFSAFGLETFELVKNHHSIAALVDVVIQVGVGTLAVAGGFALSLAVI